MKKIFTYVIGCILLSFSMNAQSPKKPSSGEIYNSIQKLNFLGSALYLAAHPDDENTRLISLMSNGMHARTAYLSLTRGDGGQNRVGTEIREKLGLIRTHELLEARKIDGGLQFFSRANDFGYSKNPEETLRIWNKDEVLHDIVKVIREFKPDVLINRFDHRGDRPNHGHHTSSALLSVEGYDLAAQAGAFEDRLSHLSPWQVKRLFFNTGWWFYGSRENFEQADKSNMIAVDIGTYFPVLGRSNTEIAAESTSMHKSQGFGRTGTRGSQMEYVELIKGEMPPGTDNLFAGINTSWSRIPGGDVVGSKINTLIAGYNFVEPSSHINALLDIYESIQNLEDDGHWKRIKLKEAEDVLIAVTGLFLEARTQTANATLGETIQVDLEAVNRSDASVVLKSISVSGYPELSMDLGIDLSSNVRHLEELSIPISESMSFSNPYWLKEAGTMGMYTVSSPELISTPQTAPSFSVQFNISIGDREFKVLRELIYNTNDAVKGEVYQPFHIVPDVSVSFSDPVYIFPDRNSKEVTVSVKSFKDDLIGTVELSNTGSWIVTPKHQVVYLKKKGSSAEFTFTVKGPVLQASGQLGITVSDTVGNSYDQQVYEINYDHIPNQVLVSEAKAKFERISLNKEGDRIAYIPGAGDDIPKSLRQIGYEVDIIEATDISHEKLTSYDAVVLGIRVYNTRPEIRLKKDDLLKYAYQGGTVITQYNTNRGIGENDIGPYMMKLSRERVTDENAVVSFENPDHEVLNYPNKITSRDFDNWVQERGLYFSNEWDFRYEAPLSCADPNEPLRSGGLLIARFGAGHVIYTGYSWFRQLPAGVPGAFRLFTNLVSIGNNKIPVETTEEKSNEKQ